MRVAWHPERWWDWCLPEDEKKVVEPIFTDAIQDKVGKCERGGKIGASCWETVNSWAKAVGNNKKLRKVGRSDKSLLSLLTSSI